MGKLQYMNTLLHSIIWGKWLIIILIGSSLWFTIRSGFLPFRHPFLIMKKTLGSLFKKKSKHGVTSFQAVSTALAGTLGVGSIVGVATAIQMGGPGSLFWMCASALITMMCKYAEVVTAMLYRQRRKDGSIYGGAMTSLEHGCGSVFLAVCFALFCILASFGIGNLAPAHTIVETVLSYITIHPIYISIAIMIVTAICIFDKGNTIMKVNEIIIPFISILYLSACFYLLYQQRSNLLNAIYLIMQDAFSFQSGIGGITGFLTSKAVHYGIARGVFSNEAGMGSSPLSHASVEDVNPVEQGFWGIFEVFFDTVVVCMITGFVYLTSPVFSMELEGVQLGIACFTQGFQKWGGYLFSISMICFAFPSILGWYYYAQQCILYLSENPIVLFIYQCLFLGFLCTAGVLNLSFVWNLSDNLNGLMAIPNLICITILSKNVLKLTKEYLDEETFR